MSDPTCRCISCDRVSTNLDDKGRCGSPKCFQFKPQRKCPACDSTEHFECECEFATEYGSDGLPEGI